MMEDFQPLKLQRENGYLEVGWVFDDMGQEPVYPHLYIKEYYNHTPEEKEEMFRQFQKGYLPDSYAGILAEEIPEVVSYIVKTLANYMVYQEML